MISINSCIEIRPIRAGLPGKIGGKMFSTAGNLITSVAYEFRRVVRVLLRLILLLKEVKSLVFSQISSPNNVVTTMRNDIDYVVTEYAGTRLIGRTELQEGHTGKCSSS